MAIALRALVLLEEPYCVGYPEGVHEGALVRTEEADHIKPRVRGGLTVRENLRGLCRTCNRRKALEDRRRTWRSR